MEIRDKASDSSKRAHSANVLSSLTKSFLSKKKKKKKVIYPYNQKLKSKLGGEKEKSMRYMMFSTKGFASLNFKCLMLNA